MSDWARAEAGGPAWVALTSKVEQLKGELYGAQDQILQLRILLREVRPLVNARSGDERLRYGVMEIRREEMVWTDRLARIDAELER